MCTTTSACIYHVTLLREIVESEMSDSSSDSGSGLREVKAIVAAEPSDSPSESVSV